MHIGSSSEEYPSISPSSSNSVVLTENDIHSICEKLKSASKDWFNLGLALGVQFSELKNIEDQYYDNVRRLTEVVGKRLESTHAKHPVTWPYICECLRSLKRDDVANEIEGKVPIYTLYISIFNIQVDIRFEG